MQLLVPLELVHSVSESNNLMLEMNEVFVCAQYKVDYMLLFLKSSGKIQQWCMGSSLVMLASIFVLMTLNLIVNHQYSGSVLSTSVVLFLIPMCHRFLIA